MEGIDGIDAVEGDVFIDDAGFGECAGALPAFEGVGYEATGAAVDAAWAEHLLVEEYLELRGEFALVDEDGAGDFGFVWGCDGAGCGCRGLLG